MSWSGLRARYKSFLAPSIRGRVDFHVTSYRQAWSQVGKGWITLDGEVLVTFCDFDFENAWRTESETNGLGNWNQEARNSVLSTHILPNGSLGEAMTFVMNHQVSQSLASSNQLIIALAALDRRTGKRRLESLPVDQLPSWAQTLIEVRKAAEMLLSAPSGTAHRSPAHPS